MIIVHSRGMEEKTSPSGGDFSMPEGHRERQNNEQGMSNVKVGAGSEPAPTIVILRFLVRYSIFNLQS